MSFYIGQVPVKHIELTFGYMENVFNKRARVSKCLWYLGCDEKIIYAKPHVPTCKEDI